MCAKKLVFTFYNEKDNLVWQFLKDIEPTKVVEFEKRMMQQFNNDNEYDEYDFNHAILSQHVTLSTWIKSREKRGEQYEI